MGKTLKLIWGVALLMLFFIWIFPSWVYVWEGPNFAFKAKIGSSWLWAPPMPYGASLDWFKNISYSLAVILAATGLQLWASTGNNTNLEKKDPFSHLGP